MNRFFAFVRKEIYHILRDTRTLVILFGLPVVLVLIFGYTVTNEFRNASMAILDQADDESSAALTAHLLASGHFELTATPRNMSELEAAFEANAVKIGLVIPAGFEQALYGAQPARVQLITDASEPNYATTLTSYANQMIAAFARERGGQRATPYQIRTETRLLYNPRMVSAYNFIPGTVALVLMLISAMMTSLTLAREKESGTMNLLLVSPLPPPLIILGKVTPYVLLAFVDALVIFGMSYYVFDVPIRGSLWLLLGLTLLYLAVALALGILISTRSKTQQEAMMFSLFVLLMPTMLLSGFMFPIPSMPEPLQLVAKMIPANYFIQIQQAVMLKGAGWSVIARPTLILAGMLILLLGAAWRNFKVVEN